MNAFEILKDKLIDSSWIQILDKGEETYVIKIDMGYASKEIPITEEQYKTLVNEINK